VFRENAIHYQLERWPDGGHEMKFRLIYDGQLPPEDKAGADLKHEIRRQFHPQLRTLWEQSPDLARLLKQDPLRDNEHVEAKLIADEFARHGFRFVPLVRLHNRMACKLNVLLLFRDDPYIFSGNQPGDLDNRIKTLIDGLQMPSHQKSAMGTTLETGPQTSEDPFFCLLENDRMVYEIAVSTDRLLAPKRPDQAFRDVIAIIQVQVANANGTEFAYPYNGFHLVKERP
jgi:hypothetical protein